jgi:hypothetical protein
VRAIYFAIGALVSAPALFTTAFAATSFAYNGPSTELVQQYKTDVDGFGKQYNKKTIHIAGASVASVTLPDPKQGAPWLISLRDETSSGSAANISCFVASSLTPAERKRALAAKKGSHIDVVAVVQADGYSLGLTDCKVVAPMAVIANRPAAPAAPAAPPPPALGLTVTNAWNDTVNGVLFVHDAVVISGGDQDVALKPDDFAISMRLANGAIKQYASLTDAAPTYQKYNAMASGYISTAYEVDPKEDLGAIGPMTVPAHGSVRVVVTFQIPDAVSTPGDNRKVSFR